jgi:predicted hydrocarbon binding protein
MSVEKTDNMVMRANLETIQGITGSNGLKSILNYAGLQRYIDNFPPDNDEREIPVEDMRVLDRSLLELFGGKGARALQLRVGREFARIAIGKRPGIEKAVKLATRLLPEHKEMRLVLERWGEEIEKREPSEVCKPRVELREEEDYFIYIDKDQYASEGIVSREPVCNGYVGIIEYLMEWITGHKHEVEEIECRATGDPADVFRIAKVHKGAKG